MGREKTFVVSAASGAGKTTLVNKVVADKPGVFYNSVSDTTRPSRRGEIEGVDYNFISVPEFKSRIDSGYHVEWAKVHKNYYGTPKEPLMDAMAKGLYPLLTIDVQGFLQVKSNMPGDNLCSIFILPPSMEELERRLLGRGDTSGNDLETRLKNARGEIGNASEFDYVVVNDDLNRAYLELKGIFDKAMGL